MTKKKNSGQLLSIYCPQCRRVTDKISFNLLREAGMVKAHCPLCRHVTHIAYDGKRATISHSEIYETGTPKQHKGWSDELIELSKTYFETSGSCLKNLNGRFGILHIDPKTKTYKVLPRDNNDAEIFEYKSVKEIIDAGWAVD